MKYTYSAALLCIALMCQAQTKVLSLGVFHFNFPNNDVVQTEESKQIDVLDKEYQQEIEQLVNKLSEFKPDKIVIERSPSKQQLVDSLFQSYVKGNHELNRGEDQQIGFRLAKKLGHSKLYCVDEWGDFTPEIQEVVFGEDTVKRDRFVDYLESDPDAEFKFRKEPIFKSQGIIAELKRINTRNYQQKSLGNYLIGAFKYEDEKGDFLGVHFETGRWFNRNLKIFRNIQRIDTGSNERILVIFGADHMNLLNIFFESSAEYELIPTEKYLP